MLELNKIKITVFPIDLNDMNISIKSLKPDSPQLHSFLFNIMEKIKKETGFNPYSGRIVVEASPIGDCVELIVTKLSEQKIEEKPNKSVKKVRAVIKKPKQKNIVYSFENFDDFCGCLAVVWNSLSKMAAYYVIGSRHILSVPESNSKQHIIQEFATGADRRKLSKSFLDEHATLVASGEELLNMAKGINELYKD